MWRMIYSAWLFSEAQKALRFGGIARPVRQSVDDTAEEAVEYAKVLIQQARQISDKPIVLEV